MPLIEGSLGRLAARSPVPTERRSAVGCASAPEAIIVAPVANTAAPAMPLHSARPSHRYARLREMLPGRSAASRGVRVDRSTGGCSVELSGLIACSADTAGVVRAGVTGWADRSDLGAWNMTRRSPYATLSSPRAVLSAATKVMVVLPRRVAQNVAPQGVKAEKSNGASLPYSSEHGQCGRGARCASKSAVFASDDGHDETLGAAGGVRNGWSWRAIP